MHPPSGIWATSNTSDRICQGQQIGLSGATGTKDPHLHVHLKPYDNSTPPRVTSDDNPAGCHDVGYPDATKEAVGAHRFRGCMNYVCFLPFDTQEEANGHTHVPASITAEILTTGTGQLLSPRDAYARIPVYREGPPENGQFRPGTTVDGTKKIDSQYVAYVRGVVFRFPEIAWPAGGPAGPVATGPENGSVGTDGEPGERIWVAPSVDTYPLPQSLGHTAGQPVVAYIQLLQSG